MKKRIKDVSILLKMNLAAILLFSVISSVSAAVHDENTNSKALYESQQKRDVKGAVVDEEGEPIVGANVVVKGTTIGVITNIDGAFSLEVPTGSVLQISYVGYLTQEIPVTGSSINVVLKEDTQRLEEVVVLGYGAQARRSDLSASIGIVKDMETLKGRPIASAESMLQGQIPGVTVVAQGGDPTSTPSVTIRGQGSTSKENVLWVVDGVPGAPFNTNDIESIVVLKDAASAAIYGAHSGSAGVILVTTKKAKTGKPSVAYEGSFGMRQATNLPQSLTIEQQRQVVNTSYAAAGQTVPSGWDPSINPEIATTRTNWIDEVFRNAFYQRHDVSINVGTEDFMNRISLNYSGDEGTLAGTYNNVLSTRYNGSFKIDKYVTISEDFMYRTKDQRGTDTNSGYSGVILSALYMPRSAVPYYEDGSYGGVCARDGDASIHGDVINPLRTLLAETRDDETNYVSSSTQLQIKDVIPGLKFISRFTYRHENWFYKNFRPISTEPGKPNGVNELSYETSKSTYWETENTLTYDNTFDKHTIGALFSTTADQFRKRGFTAGGRNFNNESEIYQYLNYATTAVTSTDYYRDPDNNIALIGRLAYSYDNRYFITASWRRDYAGRLPEGNKSGDFPAVTAGWKISEENFFPKNDIVTLLKLRASWGRIGNLGSIATAYGSPTLTKTGNNDGKQVGKDATITTNLLYLKDAFNRDLTWETSEQTDLGLDMNFLNDRLSVSADFFMKRTLDLIQSQTSGWPNYMGVSPMLINLGEIRNRGFEFMVNWNDRTSKDFSYNIGGNISILKNWVEDIGVTDATGEKSVWVQTDIPDITSNFRGTLYPFQTAEGQPLYSYYLIKTAGIFQSDAEAAAYVDKNGSRIQPNAKAGDLKFIDQNGDGKIDSDDRIYMGSYMPKVTFSLMGGFTYRKFTFSMMLQGAAKTKAFNASKFILLNETQGNFNRWNKILDAWSPTNTSGDIPRISKEDANGNFETNSDFYLEDASYLRIKNATIAYDLTDLIRKSSYLNGRKSALTIYASGENLYTFTKYSGIDPEVGGAGLDAMKYPVSRVLSLGIKLTY